MEFIHCKYILSLRANQIIHRARNMALYGCRVLYIPVAGVPFDEDEKDKSTWFLDMDYLESMYSMFHKVAAKEKIVGWYHTGPKLHKDGTPPIKTFEHVASEIGAEEAEEVGVEHLLRDIKDQTAGTLSQRITDQLMGLRGLHSQLVDIEKYLQDVAAHRLPINHPVIYHIQEVLNLLPDVTHPDYVTAQNVQTNDQLMCVYMGSLVRSVIALHNLIDNKVDLIFEHMRTYDDTVIAKQRQTVAKWMLRK
ncbi:Mov34/MPN/PAD-1 family protein [Teladorsagia circumcincta]|uniref:Mov34/MPN/PAD-1 family protein n=1 Tax=Teladorsagia circumcincta TaxID=45464 RepID=A0A2G9UT65_TELCI|nr:Mov34/MPN/PAD-1 family protein [Teladorsagia circumcincta]